MNSRGIPNMKATTMRNKSIKNRVATMLPVRVFVPDSMILPITSVWLMNSNAIILSPTKRQPG